MSGTWVPLERGLALAQEYKIEALLRPIIDFEPTSASPPLAPKHVTAVPIRTKRNGEATMATRGSKRTRAPDSSDSRASSPHGSVGDASLSSSPSRLSSGSRSASPLASTEYDSNDELQIGSMTRQSARKRKQASRHGEGDSKSRRGAEPKGPAQYGEIILDYFINDTNIIPNILINPPIDFDPNMSLDDDGHTPLHWACAMGRTRVVKLLVTAGADIFKVNKQGQTALMRSVMFGNNYDVRKFPELYEHLHKSTLNIDHSNRTVFHHIVGVVIGKGNPHAARYYMETLLTRLSTFPQELADIINFQDEEGETALTMAARCRSKRLVKLLIDHGADPKIRNRDGKSCEDYILEDERFRSSPTSRTVPLPSHASSSNALGTSIGSLSRVYHSDIARHAGAKTVAEMTALLEQLAASYDKELSEKERDLTQARFVLGSVQTEIAETQKALQSVKEKAGEFDETKARLEELENTMIAKLDESYRKAYQRWSHEEAMNKPPAVQAPPKHEDDPMDGTDALDASDLDQIEEYYRAKDTQTPEQIRAECEALREELAVHQNQRRGIFEQYVKEQSDAGTGGRMQDYRRLIAAGLGGVPTSGVDEVVGMLLEVRRGSITK